MPVGALEGHGGTRPPCPPRQAVEIEPAYVFLDGPLICQLLAKWPQSGYPISPDMASRCNRPVPNPPSCLTRRVEPEVPGQARHLGRDVYPMCTPDRSCDHGLGPETGIGGDDAWRVGARRPWERRAIALREACVVGGSARPMVSETLRRSRSRQLSKRRQFRLP